MNLFGMEGEIKEVTEKIAKHFEEMEKVSNFHLFARIDSVLHWPSTERNEEKRVHLLRNQSN